MTAINIILDAIVVCMPLSVIQTLHMSSARKAQVSGIFLLGLSCIVTSAVRVYYFGILNDVANGPETESQRKPQLIWKNNKAGSKRSVDKSLRATVTVTINFLIEAQTSTNTACLPTLAPLFHSSRHAASEARTWRSMLSLRPKVKTKSSMVHSTDVEQAGKDSGRAWEHSVSDLSHEETVAGDSNVELKVMDVV
ncbi:hypothetical protein HO133_000595 [Letharia lupina]|uniref:Rhodopsin domain-containing protein n=1 Tax=Letharia lupina TaxID=560253 RepID=A0A8H6CHW3_9LECA|nr:uncharacterized protein HO133_000595 [Letharia lupina]KAF6223752.1 hypothetical protein HO133_000595 [Letharia lupina]